MTNYAVSISGFFACLRKTLTSNWIGPSPNKFLQHPLPPLVSHSPHFIVATSLVSDILEVLLESRRVCITHCHTILSSELDMQKAFNIFLVEDTNKWIDKLYDFYSGIKACGLIFSLLKAKVLLSHLSDQRINSKILTMPYFFPQQDSFWLIGSEF